MTRKEILLRFEPHSTSVKEHRVAIYVPSKSSGAPTATEKEISRVTMSFLVKAFGGATQFATEGYYQDKTAAVHERVTYYYSYCTGEQLDEHAGEIKRIANMLCIEFDQSEVAVEIDNRMFFYKPTDAYKADYMRRRTAYQDEKKGDVPAFFKWRLELPEE